MLFTICTSSLLIYIERVVRALHLDRMQVRTDPHSNIVMALISKVSSNEEGIFSVVSQVHYCEKGDIVLLHVVTFPKLLSYVGELDYEVRHSKVVIHCVSVIPML